MRKKFCQLLGKLANFFLVTAAAPPCQARRSPEMGKKIFAPSLGEAGAFSHRGRAPYQARRLPEAGKKTFAPSLGKAGAFSHRGRTLRPGSPFTGGGKENLCPLPWGSRRLFSPRAHPQARLAVYRRRERKPLPLPLGKLAPFLTAGAPPGRARRSPGAAGCSCTGAGRRACKSTRISPRRCRTQ